MKDILFGNNNTKILKRLALMELKSHKLKTLLSGAVIFMSTCLLAMVFTVLINDGLSQAVGMPYHVTYQSVDAKAAKQLQKDIDFEAVGVYKDFGETVDENGRTGLAYMDETVLELWNYDRISGSYPQQIGEAMVSAAYLEQHQLSVGDAFDFTYTEAWTNRERTQHFIVCGVMENEELEAGKQFYILTSEAFRQMTAAQTEDTPTLAYSTQTQESVNVMARLNPEKSGLEAEALEELLEKKGNELGIEDYGILLNIGYIEGFWLDGAVLMGLLFFTVFLMFAGSFVIYSIFYIAVVNSVQMYAQLMSIGTTGRQLYRFLNIQGNILAVCFIPPGMLFSLAVSLLLSSGEWLGYDILIASGSGLLVYAVVKMALYKPAKILAGIAPVEALHYNGAGKGRRRRPLKHISPETLAVNNLNTNRKKNRMSVISLSISGTLMIAAIILLKSIDIHGMLMQSYPLGEDFQVGIQMDSLYRRFPQIVKDNPLSETLRAQIDSIPGVEKVMREEGIIGRIIEPEISYENKEDNQELIDCLSPELLSGINGIVDGSADYDDMGTDGIMINQFRAATSDYNYDDIKVGDKLRFEFETGGNTVERIFTVKGIVFFPSTGLFYTTPEILRDISADNQTLHLSVFCDGQKEEEVHRGLQEIISQNPDLRLMVYSEELALTEYAMRVYLSGVYGTFALIIFFGILNMVNLLISSALLRKREFALLEAVGMTGRQRRRMLYREGMDISIKASVLAAVLGTAFGGLLCFLANEVMSLKFVRFQISLWPVLAFTVILIGMQMGVSSLIDLRVRGTGDVEF